MDNNIQSAAPKKERITSLDALRAFTLLGILVIHAFNGFSFTYDGIHTFFDAILAKVNELFLVGKCNTVFAVLFGVSFYLILKNPKNSNAKFVWRCFLLLLIGLFNNLFYKYDVLMLYGFWGMALVLFRNLKPGYLIICCICMVIINPYLAELRLGDVLFGPSIGNRYGIDKSFVDVITYPDIVKDYLHVYMNVGTISVFAKFIFGYWIAKIGFIEHLEQRLTKPFLLIVWALFLGFFVVDRIFDRHGIGSLRIFANYSGSAAYASALLYIYYHNGFCKRVLKLFEPYGRLGLTNYSMGGIFGVIFINEFGLGLYKYSYSVVLIFFIVFFLLQAVFSYYWLRYFTYGPMEYLWRVATERKKIPLRRIID